MEVTERSVKRMTYREDVVAVNLAVKDCPPILVSATRTIWECYSLLLTFKSINGLPWMKTFALVGAVNPKNRRETNVRPEHFKDGHQPPTFAYDYMMLYFDTLDPR